MKKPSLGATFGLSILIIACVWVISFLDSFPRIFFVLLLIVLLLFLIASIYDYVDRKKKNQESLVDKYSFREGRHNDKSAKIDIPIFIDGFKRNYTYKDVEIINPCLEQMFPPDPEHPLEFDTDKDAVIIKKDGVSIGTAPNNKIGEMLKDWVRRKEPIYAIITAADEEAGTAKMFVAFYSDPMKGTTDENSFSTKLIGTTKKDFLDSPRYENIAFTDIGSFVSVLYDSETEKYMALYNSYELGEIGKSPSQKLRALEDEGYTLVAKILEKSYNFEKERDEASITVYWK